MVKNLLKACCMIAALTAAGQAAAETYTVGSGGTYRPFEFENSQKQLEGFDIDIIKAIAKAEGFDVKLVNTPWEGIFATLNTGDRDIIISGITITDKRKQMVDFSAPYFPAEQSIVVAQDSQVDSLAALKNEKVGVVNSSTGDIVVSEVLGKNSTAIKRFDNTPLMLQELFEDGVSAAVGDVGVVKYYIRRSSSSWCRMPNLSVSISVLRWRKATANCWAKSTPGCKRSLLTGLTPKSIKPGSTTTCRRCQRNNPPFSVTTAIAQAIAVFFREGL